MVLDNLFLFSEDIVIMDDFDFHRSPYGQVCWDLFQHYFQTLLSMCWHFFIDIHVVLGNSAGKKKCWHFFGFPSEVLESLCWNIARI